MQNVLFWYVNGIVSLLCFILMFLKFNCVTISPQGQGRAFCAGGDVAAVANDPNMGNFYLWCFMLRFFFFFCVILNSSLTYKSNYSPPPKLYRCWWSTWPFVVIPLWKPLWKMDKTCNFIRMLMWCNVMQITYLV